VDIQLFVIVLAFLKVLAPESVDGSLLFLAKHSCSSLSHCLEFINRYKNLRKFAVKHHSRVIIILEDLVLFLFFICIVTIIRDNLLDRYLLS